MKLIKVLNNSVLLVVNDSGQEVIVMGKGIGFGKKAGCEVREDEIQKTFVLKERSALQNIIRLASEVDASYFEVAKATIDYAKEKYGMVLHDHIYLSLTDHLASAVMRFDAGKGLHNVYLEELRIFNPNEYDVGKYCLELLCAATGREIPKGEIGYIAFHFISGQSENQNESYEQSVMDTARSIMDIIRYDRGGLTNRENTSYARLYTHVKFLAERLIKGSLVRDEGQDFLYNEITTAYPQYLSCTERINSFVKSKFSLELTKQEVLYLIIQIHRVEETREETNNA